jgi:3-deoxy-D-manno-octulosonic-acid transferase
VFVGGSLAPTGGHNPVEPARFGKAVLFGPHMHNFAAMAQDFCASGAALQVSGPEDLRRQVLRLAACPEERTKMGAAAKELILRNRGAAERNLELVLGR